jgi:hypothetical protein
MHALIRTRDLLCRFQTLCHHVTQDKKKNVFKSYLCFLFSLLIISELKSLLCEMGKSWVGCRQPDITTYQVMRSMDRGEAYKGGGYGIFSRGDRLRGRFITCCTSWHAVLLPLRRRRTLPGSKLKVSVHLFTTVLFPLFFFFYNNSY